MYDKVRAGGIVCMENAIAMEVITAVRAIRML